MTNADELIERTKEVAFRLRCDAKHKTADLMLDLAAALCEAQEEIKELRTLVVDANDVISTPHYNWGAYHMKAMANISKKANEIQDAS